MNSVNITINNDIELNKAMNLMNQVSQLVEKETGVETKTSVTISYLIKDKPDTDNTNAE